MKTRTLALWVILFGLISIFLWGVLNYGYNLTDTPDPELYQGNIDVFAIPAVIAAFGILIAIPTIVFVSVSSRRLKIIFVPLSGVVVFLIFMLVIQLIVNSSMPWGR